MLEGEQGKEKGTAKSLNHIQEKYKTKKSDGARGFRCRKGFKTATEGRVIYPRGGKKERRGVLSERGGEIANEKDAGGKAGTS